MSLAAERAVAHAVALLAKPEVMEAMAIRCTEQGHEWENCMTVVFQLYQACRWCGETRRLPTQERTTTLQQLQS